MSLALVRYRPPRTRQLLGREVLLGRLREELSDLEAVYERDRTEIRDFEKRYRPAVGTRQERLDALRDAIAEAWESIRRARAGEPVERRQEEEEVSREIPQASFNPKVELRKLFRELARRVHPDLAADPEERRRRHEFMAEATRAYRADDHRRLQWLLEHWEATPTLPPGWDPDSQLARTNQQIAWVRYRITEMHHLVAALHASPLAEVKRAADEARAQGRNYVAEMRAQVIAELEEAEADLERVESALAELDGDVVKLIRTNAGL